MTINSKTSRLTVFKDRKAKLTQATLQTLSAESLLKYDVHKRITKQGFKDTRYGTISKQINSLEKDGYLKRAGVRKTQPGSERVLYQTTSKGLLALKLNTTNMDFLLTQIDEKAASTLLTALDGL
jgi:DNA-binding PadR family transcriptional regulator